MPAKNNPKDVFMMLLSDARTNTEQTAKMYQEFSQTAQDPNLQEVLEARAWVIEKNLETLDRCFDIIGEKPQTVTGSINEFFLEEFKNEIAEIQSPPARQLYVLAKATQLAHQRFAEYATLITAAEVTGHTGVGVLLESALADKAVFLEKTQCLIQNIVEGKVAARMVA